MPALPRTLSAPWIALLARTDTSDTAVELAPLVGSEDALPLREARYRKVMREWGDGLSRVAASYGRTPAEREDLSQDIALGIWTALVGFRGDASLRTFAFRVAHNRAIASLRKRRCHESADEVVDPSPTMESHLGELRERERLIAAVRALPIGLRQVLTLHLEGMSYAEIAEIVGLSETNVSVRLTRARKLLRKQIGERT